MATLKGLLAYRAGSGRSVANVVETPEKALVDRCLRRALCSNGLALALTLPERLRLVSIEGVHRMSVCPGVFFPAWRPTALRAHATDFPGRAWCADRVDAASRVLGLHDLD